MSSDLFIKIDKENSSTNTTFTKDNAKSIFYEIPNTPVSVKKQRHRLNQIRNEIRKSINNTVTLRRKIEKEQQESSKKVQLNDTKLIQTVNGNVTYIKEDKKLKNKEKVCDVIYLKTIDNLLNAIKSELEFGRINSNFVDDHKYIEIFKDNVNKLSTHLNAKLKVSRSFK